MVGFFDCGDRSAIWLPINSIRDKDFSARQSHEYNLVMQSKHEA